MPAHAPVQLYTAVVYLVRGEWRRRSGCRVTSLPTPSRRAQGRWGGGRGGRSGGKGEKGGRRELEGKEGERREEEGRRRGALGVEALLGPRSSCTAEGFMRIRKHLASLGEASFVFFVNNVNMIENGMK